MFVSWPTVTVSLGSPVRAGRVRCEPGWRLEAGWGDGLTDFDLWFVWAGRGEMRLRDRTVVLRPGICLWMRPGGRYEAEQDPEDRLGVTFVHFDALSARGRRLAQRALPPEVTDLRHPHVMETLTRRLTDRLHQGESHDGEAIVHAEALLRAAVMEYDAQASAPRRKTGTAAHHEQVVQEVAQQIVEDPAAAPGVEDLARQAGYSVDHFGRVFREVMGRSPQAFVVAARIDRARQLLTESSLSVSQIADALGYRDVYFFSRQFKSKTGWTPTAYRDG